MDNKIYTWFMLITPFWISLICAFTFLFMVLIKWIFKNKLKANHQKIILYPFVIIKKLHNFLQKILDVILGIIFVIVAHVCVFGSWFYCIYEHGYLFGFGLGWIPSLIIATPIYFLFASAAQQIRKKFEND